MKNDGVDGQINIHDYLGDYRDCQYETTGCKRTGCVFCLFGIRQDLERISRLQKEEPKIETKQNESIPESKKQRNRIDIGKIIALKNAGWSNIRIADEMDMQPQSVASAIYQYKKKGGVKE